MLKNVYSNEVGVRDEDVIDAFVEGDANDGDEEEGDDNRQLTKNIPNWAFYPELGNQNTQMIIF